MNGSKDMLYKHFKEKLLGLQWVIIKIREKDKVDRILDYAGAERLFNCPPWGFSAKKLCSKIFDRVVARKVKDSVVENFDLL